MGSVKESLGLLYDAVKRAPVELRNDQAALMSRGTIASLDGQAKGLHKGTYSATVTLPTGQQMVHLIPVDEPGPPDLAPMAARIRTAVERVGAPATQNYAAGAQTFVQLARGELAALGLEPMGPASADTAGKAPPFFVRLFDGTLDSTRELVLQGETAGAEGLSIEPGRATITNRGPASRTLQILQTGYPYLNVLVPPGCSVIVLAGTEPFRSRITTSFGVELVDELIDLRTAGALSEASGVAQTLTKADVCEIAASHPVAATALAYIMLRAGNFAEGAKSVEALLNGPSQGTPDLMLLKAELDARRDKNSEAMAGFLAAGHRGLPMVSAGLTYLVDRLRMYTQAEAELETKAVPPDRPTHAHTGRLLQEQLTQLQGIALRCDFNVVFTNYTGESPAAAGDQIFNERALPSGWARQVHAGDGA